MLRQVVQQLVRQYGNGRAIDNAHRAMHRDRFMHEHIDVVARRVSTPANPRDRRGVA
jgi:hypothetical protein